MNTVLSRMQDLQEARVSGCVAASDAYQFIKQRRTKEVEQGGQIGTSGKTLQRPKFPKVELGSSPYDAKDTPTTIQAITITIEEWDISDFEGVELSSESEIKPCNEIRLLPPHLQGPTINNKGATLIRNHKQQFF
ncbi:unnamed protein product [Lathyrus sativus]|nr:unnamed protein product [Lathyrus sativus]